MKRTTVLADEGLLLEATNLARRQGKTLTSVIREALAEYVVAHRPKKRDLSWAPVGDSGDPTILERRREIRLVDASIVAIAERLRVTRLLTADRRHFSLIRPRHCPALELVP